MRALDRQQRGDKEAAAFRASVTQSLRLLHEKLQQMQQNMQQQFLQSQELWQQLFQQSQAQWQQLFQHQQNLFLLRQGGILVPQQQEQQGGGGPGGGDGARGGGPLGGPVGGESGGIGGGDGGGGAHVGGGGRGAGAGGRGRGRSAGGRGRSAGGRGRSAGGRGGGGPSQGRGGGNNSPLPAPPLGVPPLPSRMPESVAHVVLAWLDSDLQRYVDANKCDWGFPVRNRFSHWKYLYGKVCEKEQELRNNSNGGGGTDDATAAATAPVERTTKDSLLRAARALDVSREQLRLSVPQFLKHLKDQDPGVDRRRRS